MVGWRAQPPEPTVDEPARLKLAWFDPTGHTGIQRPRLELRRDGQQTGELRLFAGIEGFTSEPWYPPSAGEYDVVASIPSLDGEPVPVTRSLRVLPAAENADAHEARIRCEAVTAERGGEPGVLVTLVGQARQPAVVLLADGDPLAAATIRPFGGTRELFLPAVSATVGARVLVVTAGEAGAEMAASAEVHPDTDRAIALRLETPQTTALPGNVLRVSAACTRGGTPMSDASIIARLVPAKDSGYLSWLPGSAREAARTATSIPTITSSRAAATPAEPPMASLSRDGLVEALYEGTTLWIDTSDSSDHAELDVPLPPEPGLYRLIALAIAPDGATAADSVLLDTQAGVHVAVDTPAVLTTGDRTLVAVMIESPHGEPAELDLRVDPGPGLHIESARVGEEAVTASATVRMTVPAESRSWLQMRVEATEPGSGALRAEVTSAVGTQHAAAAYDVTTPDSSRPDEKVRLRRKLLRLVAEHVRTGPAPDAQTDPVMQKPSWREHAVAPGESVPPGTHLLVREELTLSELHTNIEWTQRMPANCHAVQANSHAKHEFGELRRRRINELEYTAGRLEVGFRTHEYHIVAVRPGVCRLPAPEATADGRPLAVSVEPAEMLVNVVGTP